MASHKVAALRAQMVRGTDVEMLVPQHGRPFVGKAAIGAFLGWIEKLECGIDLLGPEHFQLVR